MSDAIPNRDPAAEILAGKYDALVEACYADPEVQAELKLWEATLMDGLEEQDDA